jgi:hypothetical protein
VIRPRGLVDDIIQGVEADDVGAICESDVSRGYAPWEGGGGAAAREIQRRRWLRFLLSPAELTADAAGLRIDGAAPTAARGPLATRGRRKPRRRDRRRRLGTGPVIEIAAALFEVRVLRTGGEVSPRFLFGQRELGGREDVMGFASLLDQSCPGVLGAARADERDIGLPPPGARREA